MKLLSVSIPLSLTVCVVATSATPALSARSEQEVATARQTKTTVVCEPDTLRIGAVSSCVARAVDSAAGKKAPPAGTVTFTSNAPGDFELQPCTLETSAAAAATCTTTYRPTAIAGGIHVITASYSGSDAHNPTSGRYEISVTPVNDSRRTATPLRTPPTALDGTTVGATTDYSDPDSPCGEVASTVWYSLVSRSSGRIAVRIRARGKLDAIVSVFRVVRSQFRSLGCVPTDDTGAGGIAFQAARRGSYLIAVGERERSASSTFRLELFAPPLARAPGVRLPSRGVGAFVDPLTKPEAAWSVDLRAGVSYRLNLAPERNRCLALSIFSPGTSSFTGTLAMRQASCGGYLVLTPGRGKGGRYSLLVRAQGNRGGTQRYRLRIAPAGRDDTAPGLPIEDGQTRRGSLSGHSIDALDLYRFEIDHRTDVTARLGKPRSAHFELRLLSGDGTLVRCVCARRRVPELRARLDAGDYFIAVQARAQSAGRYRLGLLVREITTTVVLVDDLAEATAQLGRAVELSARVSPAVSGGGRVQFRIDRFDPIEGWQYSRTLTAAVNTGGGAARSWSPPSVGRWRIRAFFVGTRAASPSASSNVLLSVRA